MTEKRLRADVLLSSKEPAESCSFTQWLFLCFIKNIPPHTWAVWGKAPTMLEKQRKIILLPVVHQMAIKNKSQKNKQTRGCEIFEAAKAQHENGGKTLAGWSWNSHKCFFLYRIYHQPINLYLLHYSCRKGFVNPLRYTLSNLIRFKIKMRKRDCLLFTDKHYFRLCIGACLESFWIKFGHHWCPLMAKQT